MRHAAAKPRKDELRRHGKIRGPKLMSDQMQSEIADLNHQMELINDPRRCYALVQERIRRYRQSGTKVPNDLALLEKQLLTECLAESQGR